MYKRQILSYETDEKYIYSFAKVVDSYTKLKEWGTAEYEQLGVYIDEMCIRDRYGGVPAKMIKENISWRE